MCDISPRVEGSVPNIRSIPRSFASVPSERIGQRDRTPPAVVAAPPDRSAVTINLVVGSNYGLRRDESLPCQFLIDPVGNGDQPVERRCAGFMTNGDVAAGHAGEGLDERCDGASADYPVTPVGRTIQFGGRLSPPKDGEPCFFDMTLRVITSGRPDDRDLARRLAEPHATVERVLTATALQ